jgi:hypothetical protein
VFLKIREVEVTEAPKIDTTTTDDDLAYMTKILLWKWELSYSIHKSSPLAKPIQFAFSHPILLRFV